MAAASIPFLDAFDAYPRKHRKAPAAQLWQETAESYPGGEAALSRAILAAFAGGLLNRPPYNGEEKYQPTFESFLADRGWEDPVGRQSSNGALKPRVLREIPD